ncbi:hypothetical protein MOZ60_10680 [Stecheria sp. CLA-KB-P133]|uniref:Uncharacterized protein n=1 Tax=Grylomicrobium aquisgranensis TaxID=2926318 RepID=A0AB35U696_9FIRM|nr:hypothetical protein [Stecheria sp. CLA-KB-P133]
MIEAFQPEPGRCYLVDSITFSNGFSFDKSIVSFTDDFLIRYTNQMKIMDWYALRTVNRIRGVKPIKKYNL